MKTKRFFSLLSISVLSAEVLRFLGSPVCRLGLCSRVIAILHVFKTDNRFILNLYNLWLLANAKSWAPTTAAAFAVEEKQPNYEYNMRFVCKFDKWCRMNQILLFHFFFFAFCLFRFHLLFSFLFGKKQFILCCCIFFPISFF